ncbi:hypothetical protein [Cysteiniphilum halobium]|uniref:hypothetical protein n=1 Tax=Cysteiniphilum halobium TaxID=2219059 RepID=UPI003F835F77
MANLSIKIVTRVVNTFTVMILLSVSGCALLPTSKITDIIAPDQKTVNRTGIYTNLQAGDNAMLVEEIGDKDGMIIQPKEALIIISKPTDSPFELNYFSYDRSWWAYGISALFWFFLATLVLAVVLLMKILVRGKK